MNSIIWLKERCLGRVARIFGRQPARDRIVLLLRLENLSPLADHLGQAGVAHLFAQLSMRMIDTVRPQDFVQNAAPGVFTILLRTRSEVEALRIAERLQQTCQAECPVNGITVKPVLTGVLVQNLDKPPRHVAQLVRCGMRHLNDNPVEQLGRIKLVAYDRNGCGDLIPATVKDAAIKGQIQAYFQPQVCCDTGDVTGFEALARWNHPVRGLLGPQDFIPSMNKADHNALTHAMLLQCLLALQLWDAQGWNIKNVSLNVEQSDLSDPAFVDMVLWELDRHEISRDRLIIEVLESIGPMNSSDQIRSNVMRLSQAGCLLDLDDFGIGYAGLGSLHHFGVNRIKIDRGFVTDCHRDPRQRRMVLAILAMAERLEIKTLAEGVETSDEHSYLAQIGCGFVQGYAVARPMPLDETGAFMSKFLDARPTLPKLSGRRAS
ncbi:GGDEF domain-containing phosphodiesterase [Paracoccus tegillarcae]|nr:GGDEF domain-containing phosphodiesterase [Paracoccus tegillarcae]